MEAIDMFKDTDFSDGDGGPMDGVLQTTITQVDNGWIITFLYDEDVALQEVFVNKDTLIERLKALI